MTENELKNTPFPNKKNEYDEALLNKTFLLAQQLNQSKSVATQEALIKQGSSIADELKKLNVDTETIAAAILYPSFLDTNDIKDIVSKSVGENVLKLLIGALRMGVIDTLQNRSTGFSQQQNQVDNLRKMLLAIVDDIRVVLIKLAERVIALNEFRHHSKSEQQQLAQQAMKLYAPLANRLGIGQFKWQIEDLSFRYLDPEMYQNISKALNMRRKDRELYIQNIIEKLHMLLKEANIKNISISGRPKHIYSIYRKIKRKRVNFREIYDASAVRILVPTLRDCYTVLGIVHSTWLHIPQEFDDYIAKPKPNGYQSIHTAVIGPENKNVEIQIRTVEMHEKAELGVAAHWKYKENMESSYETKVNWLRDVMDWQKEISKESSLLIKPYKNIFSDHVYVFTPNNDILDLEAGATPLDFAYHVHTAVGHHCRGAKVNGRLVPLTHKLKTGDRVEIQTIKIGKPSRDWLNPSLGYLKTTIARNKVKHWFRQLDREENIQLGQTLWDKTRHQSGVSKSALKDVLEHFNFKTVEDLFAAIGAGDIGVATVLHRIRPETIPLSEVDVKAPLQKPLASKQKKPNSYINIEGVKNLLTQLAHCCQPIPGDLIAGYITKTRGVTIHQQSCPNLQTATKQHPERMIATHWGKDLPEKYPVGLSIHVNDRAGLLRDISNLIASKHLTILGINSYTNKAKNEAHISLTVEINQQASLDKLIRELEQVPGVTTVMRR